jgi:type II secretion system protein J
MNTARQLKRQDECDTLALTPALSPEERVRGGGARWHLWRRRVSCAFGRGENLENELRLGRAPSPGGEGRGEGGQPSQYISLRAFTLIEIMVAVAAFAIVLAAINTIFYTALRLRNSTTAAIEKALPMEHALGVIRRDLANLVLPGGTMSGTLSTTSTSNSVAGQASPSFYTTTGVIDENTPFAEVQRVSYLLVVSTNNGIGKDLVRSVSRNLLPSLQSQTEQEPLMTGVQTLTFLYHDGSQWRDSWDSTIESTTTGVSNGLPAAVKVQIQLATESSSGSRGRSREMPMELVVPLVTQQRTNQAAQVAAAGGAQ